LPIIAASLHRSNCGGKIYRNGFDVLMSWWRNKLGREGSSGSWIMRRVTGFNPDSRSVPVVSPELRVIRKIFYFRDKPGTSYYATSTDSTLNGPKQLYSP
jgi:hypothetical protein